MTRKELTTKIKAALLKELHFGDASHLMESIYKMNDDYNLAGELAETISTAASKEASTYDLIEAVDLYEHHNGEINFAQLLISILPSLSDTDLKELRGTMNAYYMEFPWDDEETKEVV